MYKFSTEILERICVLVPRRVLAYSGESRSATPEVSESISLAGFHISVCYLSASSLHRQVVTISVDRVSSSAWPSAQAVMGPVDKMVDTFSEATVVETGLRICGLWAVFYPFENNIRPPPHT